MDFAEIMDTCSKISQLETQTHLGVALYFSRDYCLLVVVTGEDSGSVSRASTFVWSPFLSVGYLKGISPLHTIWVRAWQTQGNGKRQSSLRIDNHPVGKGGLVLNSRVICGKIPYVGRKTASTAAVDHTHDHPPELKAMHRQRTF